MKLIKEIRQTLNNKFNVIKERPDLLKSDRKLPWNIYHSDETLGSHLKKFNLFHYVFKYRMFVPILLISERILKKLKLSIPKGKHNTIVRAIDEEFDAALVDWNLMFRTYATRHHPEKKRKLNNLKKGLHTNPSNRMLRIMKKLVLSIYIFDTAYREFINIFMFRMSKRMNIEFKDKPYHLFYTSKDIHDVEYLIINNLLNGHIQISKVNKRGESKMVAFDLALLMQGGYKLVEVIK